MSETINAIKVNNINFSFTSENQRLQVLKDLSFEVKEKEFITIIGPSGCGKTTVLKVLGSLYSSSTKNVHIDGDITVRGVTAEEARRKREFGFAFQKPVLLPWRKVIDNVTLPLDVIGNQNKTTNWNPHELLDLVGLLDFKDAYPRELSGGMQQRVAIARALVFKPSIILMDEPFGALDEVTREDLNLELLRIWKSTNATIIFVTHSLTEAAFLANRVIVLSARPSKVAVILSVSLPEDRKIKMKESKEFLETVRSLREGLENRTSL